MKTKNQLLLIGIIFFIATFFRFWNLSDRAIFLGDQGRDLLIIRESLLNHKILLTGQPTSQGINTGPAYYYLIAPSLLLSKFSPLGPIYFFTFTGILSLLLIFILCYKLTGFLPAAMTTLVFATSPAIIKQTIGFWNPIPVPLLSLLILLSLYQINQKKLFWFIILGITLGLIIQFHTSSYFIFLPVLGWWIVKRRNTFLWTAMAGIFFLISLAPFLIFQLKNDFIDLKKIVAVFLEKFLGTAASQKEQGLFLKNLVNIFNQQFELLGIFKSLPPNLILGLVIIAVSLLINPRLTNRWFYFILIWFFGGITAVSLYSGYIYPHYASFIWPFPFLILGFFIKKLEYFLPKKAFFAIGLIILIVQIKNFYSSYQPKNDLRRTQEAAQAIVSQVNGNLFALTLSSKRTPSDAHLRYLLALKKISIKKIDDQSADYLFLVYEKDNDNPKPTPESIISDSECLPECPPFEKQKKIDLKKWSLIKRTELSWGAIYTYKHKLL